MPCAPGLVHLLPPQALALMVSVLSAVASFLPPRALALVRNASPRASILVRTHVDVLAWYLLPPALVV